MHGAPVNIGPGQATPRATKRWYSLGLGLVCLLSGLGATATASAFSSTPVPTALRAPAEIGWFDAHQPLTGTAWVYHHLLENHRLALGEERIQKVRGWLSKEDLRLFLQAVEQ